MPDFQEMYKQYVTVVHHSARDAIKTLQKKSTHTHTHILLSPLLSGRCNLTLELTMQNLTEQSEVVCVQIAPPPPLEREDVIHRLKAGSLTSDIESASPTHPQLFLGKVTVSSNHVGSSSNGKKTRRGGDSQGRDKWNSIMQRAKQAGRFTQGCSCCPRFPRTIARKQPRQGGSQIIFPAWAAKAHRAITWGLFRSGMVRLAVLPRSYQGRVVVLILLKEKW